MPIMFPKYLNQRKDDDQFIIESFYFIIANVPWTQQTLRKFCWDQLFCVACCYFTDGSKCEKCGKKTIELWNSDNIIKEE